MVTNSTTSLYSRSPRMDQKTIKQLETEAFLELAKNYEMAMEEIKALREQIQYLQTQVYGGHTK